MPSTASPHDTRHVTDGSPLEHVSDRVTKAPVTPTRDELVQGLIRIGEQGIVGGDDAALDAYFAEGFVFHGPGGDVDLAALKILWAAMRDAFTNLTITREHIIVEGTSVASQTTFDGLFEREFTQSPVGPLPPTGERYTLTLLNLFRYDETGRLVEEWVQYDTRDQLRQLGAG